MWELNLAEECCRCQCGPLRVVLMNSKTRLSRIRNQTKWVVIANGEPVSFGLED